MLAALLLVAQVAATDSHPNAQSPRVGDPDTVATCRLPDDPQRRTWSLAQRNGAWLVVFQSRALDKPHVELRLPGVNPIVTPNETRVSFKSANGGRSVEWRIANSDSTLDLYVNHGLEVNVEADLDPAVDLMNTEGVIKVHCGPPSPAARASADPEWMVAAGVAQSVKLFQSTAGRSYAVQTIGWGRELTGDWGPGALRGRFTWAVEAMPVFAQFSPSAIYGVGFAPVVWRWNFRPRSRYSVFAELSMGGMWTTEPIPERTSHGNFTAHWGGGVRLWPRGGDALLLAYRFQHFSNGNQLGSNPGVNSHVVLIGWSHRS
jgi:hypothetical protein